MALQERVEMIHKLTPIEQMEESFGAMEYVGDIGEGVRSVRIEPFTGGTVIVDRKIKDGKPSYMVDVALPRAHVSFTIDEGGLLSRTVTPRTGDAREGEVFKVETITDEQMTSAERKNQGLAMGEWLADTLRVKSPDLIGALPPISLRPIDKKINPISNNDREK